MAWMKWVNGAKAVGFSNPCVLRRLQAVERALGTDRSEVAGQFYYLLGRYLVRRDFLPLFSEGYGSRRSNDAPWLQSPKRKLKDAFIRQGIRGVWLTRGWFGRLRIEFGGAEITPDVILVKRNIRVFYLGQGLTAKISRKKGPGKVSTEIAFRTSVVEPQGIFQGPRLITHGEDQDWYLEELVKGRIANTKDHKMLEQALFPKLAQHYDCNRLENAPFSTTQLGARLKRLCDQRTVATIDDWLERNVLISQCHGDLELHNIFMVDGERPVPVDWDTAGLGSVVADVASLASLRDDWTRFWNHWLMERSPTGNPLRVEDMVAIKKFVCSGKK